MNSAPTSTEIIQFNTSLTIAPERVFRFCHENDPRSFAWFITALARKNGELFDDWAPPMRDSKDSDDSYQKKVEASFMELTGKTLANVISSGRSYAGLWAAAIISRGLTLVPEFLADDQAHDLSLPLRHWFQECQLDAVLGPDVISRITSFLLEVVPQIRRYAQVDDNIVALLVDEQEGFVFPRKARYALEAIKIAKRKLGTVPSDLARVIAKAITDEKVTFREMGEQVEALGFAPKLADSVKFSIPAAAFLINRDNDQPGVDYLIRATGDAEINFMEKYLDRGPFVLRQDLGSEADAARKEYVKKNCNA